MRGLTICSGLTCHRTKVADLLITGDNQLGLHTVPGPGLQVRQNQTVLLHAVQRYSLEGV